MPTANGDKVFLCIVAFVKDPGSPATEMVVVIFLSDVFGTALSVPPRLI
jgi:hypothetical protein